MLLSSTSVPSVATTVLLSNTSVLFCNLNSFRIQSYNVGYSGKNMTCCISGKWIKESRQTFSFNTYVYERIHDNYTMWTWQTGKWDGKWNKLTLLSDFLGWKMEQVSLVIRLLGMENGTRFPCYQTPWDGKWNKFPLLSDFLGWKMEQVSLVIRLLGMENGKLTKSLFTGIIQKYRGYSSVFFYPLCRIE